MLACSLLAPGLLFLVVIVRGIAGRSHRILRYFGSGLYLGAVLKFLPPDTAQIQVVLRELHFRISEDACTFIGFASQSKGTWPKEGARTAVEVAPRKTPLSIQCKCRIVARSTAPEQRYAHLILPTPTWYARRRCEATQEQL